MSKLQAFYDNTALLSRALGITPLLYGSLGLEYLTGKDLHADDIDVLIPQTFLLDRWAELCAALESAGYVLIDEHEHTFEKGGLHYSYARLEELESFAGILPTEIGIAEDGGVRFYLLSPSQYLKVYAASSRDGYRANVRHKKDAEKIAVIQEHLRYTQA